MDTSFLFDCQHPLEPFQVRGGGLASMMLPSFFLLLRQTLSFAAVRYRNSLDSTFLMHALVEIEGGIMTMNTAYEWFNIKGSSFGASFRRRTCLVSESIMMCG